MRSQRTAKKAQAQLPKRMTNAQRQITFEEQRQARWTEAVALHKQRMMKRRKV